MPVMHKACLLFVRPMEPSFVPRHNRRYDVPVDHMTDRYKPVGVELATRYAEGNGDEYEVTETIPVKSVKLPDIHRLKQLPRTGQFSIFNEKHMQLAVELMQIFDNCVTIDDLISTALYVRDQVNPLLFAYVYSVVLSHRKDEKLQLPTLMETFPEKFLKRDIIKAINEDGFILPDAIRKPIEVPFERTSSKMNPEHAMSYFREDVGINAHHWHWHLVFPSNAPKAEYYNKDRRGELFFYMHNQMINRYNCGRLTEDIPIVESFSDFRQIITNGVYPKMTTKTTNRNIPPRQNNVYWQNLRRSEDDLYVTVNDLERWRDRIFAAIDEGFVYDKSGNRIQLNNPAGIDILGNILEASKLSVNPQFYGNLHNLGHSLTAFCHDPEGKYNQGNGLIGDLTTAVRDPFFFRWHSFINDVCIRHKEAQTPYTNDELKFDNIHITAIELISAETKAATTEFRTFWQQTDVNVANGLDFRKPDALFVRLTHLNYEHFSYKISVDNRNEVSSKGTVRIFLTLVNGQAKQPLKFNGCRRHAIELDRFAVNLKPGANRIVRKSTESSLTIPFEATFPPLTVDQSGTLLTTVGSALDQEGKQCTCGWPQHHLLPKGNKNGYAYRIFVMISDFKQDAVKQAGKIVDTCDTGIIFCGLRGLKYPDARSLGFPFDRPATPDIVELDDFVENRENMLLAPITIRHIDQILKRISADNLTVVKKPANNTTATAAEPAETE